MKYKAVLFDLDGTLLDTLQDLADSMNEVLSRQGLATHPLDSYRYFVGQGVAHLARMALPEDKRSHEIVSETVNAMRQEYSRRWNATTAPYPGVPELLDELTARKIPMTILSNKPDDYTKMMVEHLLPKWNFEIVAGALPDVPRKPDPTAAVNIANRLNIVPAEFLYFGDTDTDMQTAVAAGMEPLGALWGFRTAEELRGAGAAVLLQHPLDALDLLNGKG